jgi:hypothetical protein
MYATTSKEQVVFLNNLLGLAMQTLCCSTKFMPRRLTICIASRDDGMIVHHHANDGESIAPALEHKPSYDVQPCRPMRYVNKPNRHHTVHSVSPATVNG